MYETRTKVWISTLAISTGIFEVNSEITDNQSKVSWIDDNGYTRFCRDEGKDWHRTKEGAIARAMKMRDDRIIRLRKQISRLEKLTFT